LKRLIINADGLGFSPAVNRGIYEAATKGVVTSISCVANFPSVEEIPKLAKDFKGVSLGIHFNLSFGRPVSPPEKVPSLVNDDGEFWGSEFGKRAISGKIRYSEAREELENQLRVLLRLGIYPTHWSGAQDKHLYPPFFFSALYVARKYGILRMRTHRRYLFSIVKRKYIPIFRLGKLRRVMTHSIMRLLMKIAELRGFKMADRLITPIYSGTTDDSGKYLLSVWLTTIQNLPSGTSEIICHPGYVDDILKKYAKYVNEREQEVKILTSEELKKEIMENKIELISFREL
jgi:predicted glycoside hydrolase/deacetylase ChbG (UPF0249 family)